MTRRVRFVVCGVVVFWLLFAMVFPVVYQNKSAAIRFRNKRIDDAIISRNNGVWDWDSMGSPAEFCRNNPIDHRCGGLPERQAEIPTRSSGVQDK